MATPEVDRNVTINVMRLKTRNQLCFALNVVKVIPTENGNSRYWRGLAELCGLNGVHLQAIHGKEDPTAKVLDFWSDKDPKNSTVATLMSFLEELDRFDVADDIAEMIDEDIILYNKDKDKVALRPNLECDKYILTRDDAIRCSQGLPLEIYDAFLLYADDDINFGTELLNTMEKVHRLKFCVKDRDFVGGGFDQNNMIKMIAERCNRLIVIVSDAFFASKYNMYYLSFAQAYGIEGQRKVIPCAYKQCTLPPELMGTYILKYTPTSNFDFWGKLKDSIVSTRSLSVQPALTLSRSRSANSPITRSSLHHEGVPHEPKPHCTVKFSSGSMINLCEKVSDLESPCPPVEKKVSIAKKLKKLLGGSHLKSKRKAEAVAN